MRAFVLVAAATFVLVLSGCGGGGGDPKKTASDYFNAIAAGDYRQACDQLDPGMAFGIADSIINSGSSPGLSLIMAAGDALPKNPKTPTTPQQCAQLLRTIMRSGQVDAGQLRFAKFEERMQGKTAYVRVSGLPDTSSLPVDLLPSLLTLKTEHGGWKVTQLGG